MSVADHELEEPSDDCWCASCEHYKPCACRDEEADRQFDLMRERTLEVRAQLREKGRR